VQAQWLNLQRAPTTSTHFTCLHPLLHAMRAGALPVAYHCSLPQAGTIQQPCKSPPQPEAQTRP
jgi:hypothetical protein